jgi:hypothetical protein
LSCIIQTIIIQLADIIPRSAILIEESANQEKLVAIAAPESPVRIIGKPLVLAERLA